MLVNTQVFRETALYYKKYKRFPDGDFGSYEYNDFWDREQERSINGYKVGDTKITGYHYFYLNYCPILLNEKTYSEVHKERAKHAERKRDFADFWEVDFEYFWGLEIAEFGISLEEFRKLPVTLNIDEKFLDGGRHFMWLKPRGVGAPQPIDEVVITPEGERLIGNISIGDFVINRQGIPVKVKEVHPQGELEVYEVILLDGRTVQCGKDHNWTVETRVRNGKPEYKTLTTSKMLESGLVYNHSTGQKTYKYKIPELSPVQFSEKELPIPPYVLGALLGDGTMSGKNIKIASDDIEVVNKITSDMYNDWGVEFIANKDNSNNNYIISPKNQYEVDYKEREKDYSKQGRINKLKREIEDLHINVKGEEKHIPEIYKYCSVEQRLELVKGLMDTDGSVSEQGYCEFTNKSKKLIDDLAYILRSLGIYCSIGENTDTRIKTITDRTGRTTQFTETGYYRLYIATNQNIFNLPRKSSRINYKKRTRSSCPIVEIRATGVKKQQVCLGVESEEHLYLTRDFIVTHNSFKGASLAARNFYCIRESKSFLLAGFEPYLNKDGLWNKFLDYKDWLNLAGRDGYLRPDIQRNGFYKSTDFINKREEMHMRASKKSGRDETGYKSEVMGVVIDNPEKARGKRGKLVLYEELGNFLNADSAWNINRNSTEEDGITFGMQVGFGTGGTKGANFEALTRMYYSPEAYNILPYFNVYDDNLQGSHCGYFTPAYKTITYKDADGNCDIETGKLIYNNKREQAKKSSNPLAHNQECAENPFKPAEATLATGGNIFNTPELAAHFHWVEATQAYRTGATQVMLERNKDQVLETKICLDRTPVNAYPINKGEGVDIRGVILMYDPPVKIEGKIPKIYTIDVDTYRHESSTSDSVGRIDVWMNPNNVVRDGGDRLVAQFTGTPRTQDEFNKIVFDLGEFYNCEGEVGFENDEPGGLVDYAKRHHKTKYLREEFELGYDEVISTAKSSVRRGYGMHMGSGKNNLRKLQGDKYIADWLISPRATQEDGKVLLNLHTIKDIGLLKEFQSYRADGNYDRISAMRVRMYHIREIIYSGVDFDKVTKVKKVKPNGFFARPKFVKK